MNLNPRECPSSEGVSLTRESVPHPRKCPSSEGVSLTRGSAPHPRECPSPEGVSLTRRSSPHLRDWPSPEGVPLTRGSVPQVFKATASRFAHLKELSLNFSSSSTVCNLCQSSPSSRILFPLWFITLSVVFSYVGKLLF